MCSSKRALYNVCYSYINAFEAVLMKNQAKLKFDR